MLSNSPRPQSAGTVTLKSNDPFEAPVIDPKLVYQPTIHAGDFSYIVHFARYLSTENDVAVLVRGIKFILRLIKTEPLASVLQHDNDPLLDYRLDGLTDAELEAEVRKRPETLYHPTVSCRMAREEDGGVVDAYLRVHGIENLRIADASVFTRIPAGHTVRCLFFFF